MSIENTQHISVLLQEVLNWLEPRSGGLYIDGTLGGGGHTSAILEASAPDGRVLGIDADEQALARVRQRLALPIDQQRLLLKQGNFARMSEFAEAVAWPAVDGVLLDLGFSSDQMNNPERGFSFSADGPLDMRLDQSLEESAADLVNDAEETALADIFWRYGEERRSRLFARRIVSERAKQPITRTAQLARLLAKGIPFQYGGIHPATRAFQGLRIAVNQELQHLEEVLPQIVTLLRHSQAETRGGRVAIISFHSLEDRIVKNFFRQEAKDCICPPRTPACICGHRARLRILTARPVTPNEAEVNLNPRARSAKLRVAEYL